MTWVLVGLTLFAFLTGFGLFLFMVAVVLRLPLRRRPPIRADWGYEDVPLPSRPAAQSREKPPPPPPKPSTDMARREALRLLGLGRDASPAEIKAAHRRLMKTQHPDHGGDPVMAARLNAARDLLLTRSVVE